MPPHSIYLDYNATAPMLPEVADAVRGASLRFPGNPASQHEAGRQARRALETARRRIGEILGARMTGMDAAQVIFTSGGTEANNLALFGLVRVAAVPRAGGFIPPARLITSAMEHASVARTADQLAASGCEVSQLPLDRHGIVQLEQLARLLDKNSSGPLPLEGRAGEGVGAGYQASSPLPNPPHQGAGTVGQPFQADEPRRETAPSPAARQAGKPDPRSQTLVSVMLASNETGAIQPVANIAALCREHDALIHTDASQAVAKIPVSFAALNVDALTVAAHKFHGPLGIGALILRQGVNLQPTLFGGFQQAGLRPGTEPVPLAVGMQTALELWQKEADDRQQRMASLRDRFEQAIRAGYPDAVVIGAEVSRTPHTSNIAFVGVDRQALTMALDLEGVSCSTGSACASGSSEPSPTLLAMGLGEPVIRSAVRFSLGAPTTAAEIDEAARRILSVANRLRGKK